MNYGATPNADYNAEAGDKLRNLMGPRCPSVHIWSDSKCTRHLGHTGRCHAAACGGAGIIKRAEWYSKDGKFHTHHGYITIYPRNAE